MTRTMYHGTIDKYLPAIQAEGLKPTPENAFRGRIGMFFTSPVFQSKMFVFLTSSVRTATGFAQLKANYLAAPPGAIVMDNLQLFSMRKTAKFEETAKPVLLTLEIPQDVRLIRDIETLSDSGYKYRGAIPAEWIRDAKML